MVVGGWWSLGAVLNKKKSSSLRTPAQKCNWPTIKSQHAYIIKKCKCQQQTLGDAEACCSMLELRKQELISCSLAMSLLMRACTCCLHKKEVQFCDGGQGKETGIAESQKTVQNGVWPCTCAVGPSIAYQRHAGGCRMQIKSLLESSVNSDQAPTSCQSHWAQCLGRAWRWGCQKASGGKNSSHPNLNETYTYDFECQKSKSQNPKWWLKWCFGGKLRLTFGFCIPNVRCVRGYTTTPLPLRHLRNPSFWPFLGLSCFAFSIVSPAIHYQYCASYCLLRGWWWVQGIHSRYPQRRVHRTRPMLGGKWEAGGHFGVPGGHELPPAHIRKLLLGP
uniref:Uncharacterized protein n=1 Tax=Eutreptiella gymnastica TaxID=73025 RepID=A0A7S4GAG1_9EUGL